MKGFIKRYIVHLEWHKGYKPHFSIRHMPRHGDRVKDGGVPGTLKRCPTCSGQGYLVQPDPEHFPPMLMHTPEVGVYLPPNEQFLEEVDQGLWTGKVRQDDEGIVIDMKRRSPSQEKHGS